MNFLSLVFFAFLLFFLIVYFIVDRQYRYIVILIGSYIFYGYSNPKILLTLILVTIVSYFGGIVIHQSNNSKSVYALFFCVEILILFLYKYLGFFVENINIVLSKMGVSMQISTHFELVLPVGLSFIIFQACTYLSDIYRGGIDVEKNFVRYAAFVSFFPTVLCGPIQKARKLIPQIKNPLPFDFEQAQKGVLLFIWGLFEKIMVANKLSQISTAVLNEYLNKSSAEILIGSICFSLYIYADFSSYSDMARGIAKIMGIDVGKNFNNPYLAKTTSEFWNRWHMSLNEWFVENIYIPLGGNRKGVFRKYINIMIVFSISGLWHGASWHYIAWGIVNGFLVVIGRIVRPLKIYLYKDKIDENAESVVFIKRAIVFFMITLTWVLFNNKILDSLRIWKRIIFFDFISLFNPELLNIAGTAATTFITVVMTLIFVIVQCKRINENEKYLVYKKQPFLIQCLIVAIFICICVFGVCETDANVDTQFLYFKF